MFFIFPTQQKTVIVMGGSLEKAVGTMKKGDPCDIDLDKKEVK